MIDRIRRDLRYAVRALRQQPMFVLVAVTCLAVGISVNTAAFSLLNAIVFRDYPGVERQSELAGVFIGFTTEEGNRQVGRASLADWDVMKAGAAAFSGIAASGNVPVAVRVSGDARAIRGAVVSTNYFDVLGTRPAVGRLLTSTDRDDVVVISHALWTRTFNARPDVLGQPVMIGTRQFTIIGVTAEGFFGLYPAEVIDPDFGSPEMYLPLSAVAAVRPARTTSAPIDDRWLNVFGRLNSGITDDAASSQVTALARELATLYPAQRREAFAEVRSGLGIATENADLVTAIVSAMAVPVLILLVACANLANQMAARGLQRRREIAVRLSLGASRSHVVTQLLIEAVLLSLASGAAAAVLARWTLDAVRAWMLPTPFAIPIDARVVAFTIVLGLATAVAFGLLPALGATRPDLTDALKDGASGYRRSRMRSALVVIQIAASLAMIAVASVFARVAQPSASSELHELNDRSLLMSIDLDLLGFDEPAGRAFQASMVDRLQQLPGVAAVGMAPFSMFELMRSEPVTLPGADRGPRYLKVAEVSGDWLDATNTRVIRGRTFTPAETNAPPSVAIVDEEIARYLWRDADPIGQSLRIGDPEIATVTVIGVIPTRKVLSYRQPEGIVIIPRARYRAQTNVYIRTVADASTMIPAVRESVRALDARVPIVSVQTIEDAAAFEVASLTSVSSGLAVLGVVALALAAIGLFGVLAFIVTQRRYEIGVRMALGAQRRNVVWMVVRHALSLGVAGVAAGTLLMMVVVMLMQAIIWGLQPLDPAVFASVASTMLVVVFAASLVPALRAASVDPIRSLRVE